MTALVGSIQSSGLVAAAANATISHTVTAGNAIVVWGWVEGATTPYTSITVTDGGDAFTNGAPYTNSARSVFAACCFSTSGGAKTITVTFNGGSGGGYGEFFSAEVSGLAAFDQTNSVAGFTSSPAAITGGTTDVGTTNFVVAAYCAGGGGTSNAISSPCTGGATWTAAGVSNNDSTNASGQASYRINTSAVNNQPSWTFATTPLVDGAVAAVWSFSGGGGAFNLAPSANLGVAGTVAASGDIQFTKPFNLAESANLGISGTLGVSGNIQFALPWDFAGATPISTIAGALGIAGDISFVTQLDLHASTLALTGALGVSGNLQYLKPFDVVPSALPIAGSVGVAGDIAFTSASSFDLSVAPLAIAGALALAGDIQTLKPFNLAAGTIGIAGAMAAAGDIKAGKPFDVAQTAAVSVAGIVTLPGIVTLRADFDSGGGGGPDEEGEAEKHFAKQAKAGKRLYERPVKKVSPPVIAPAVAPPPPAEVLPGNTPAPAGAGLESILAQAPAVALPQPAVEDDEAALIAAFEQLLMEMEFDD